ncbi:scavenger receptor cysteine-rich type 1 protein M130-like, partial [Archocentrus centrarchus]|uniref:scavenger receptor cysteine-rich type 1 protein M130-like n=1 Tax=Archocentrus centrarchus TaxID=63155 RepID=UPI0011EA3395
MDHLFVLLLLLWSSGVQAEDEHESAEPDDIRLVGGVSRCAGTLEVKHEGDWKPVHIPDCTLKEAAAVCEHLDCGSAVSVEQSSDSSVWRISSTCVQSGSALRNCVTSGYSSSVMDVSCSDSVRLLNGSSLCSGRLEVKSNQSWSSVCEADFDQQDAEVVCRELGCGPPSVLQGALYGEVEAPVWSREFQCGGHESALLDCRSSGSARSSCSPGKAVGLTCSEPVRFAGQNSLCEGILEVKQGDWRTIDYFDWSLEEANVVCERLGCGSAVSIQWKNESSERSVWMITPDCVQSGSALRECATSDSSSLTLNITCRDSVRLLNGSSLCSGRLEVKSNQSWSSVCEADFDQQDAEVVCRELGCGPPSVLQGALYGEVEAPVWSREFQCGGHESALLDCRSSGSARSSCSPGKAVGLTCSEPHDFRLVGGVSRCEGRIELKHLGEWRPMYNFRLNLKDAAVVCEHLGCGSNVSVEERKLSARNVWEITPDCPQFRFALRECATSSYYYYILSLTCSDSVRLLNGSSLCSGRLEVKSNQSWSSVCEADSDRQDAEVVCKGSGCRSPSGLQWAPCGETEQQDAFCSEPNDVRLVGGASRCAGTLELKHRGEWRPVFGCDWILGDTADAVCERLHCGPFDYGGVMKSSHRSVWLIRPAQPGSALRECPTSEHSLFILKLTCSDLLIQTIISVSSMDGVSEAQQQGLQVSRGSSFTISCSIQPQYPGGFFQLTFTSSN